MVVFYEDAAPGGATGGTVGARGIVALDLDGAVAGPEEVPVVAVGGLGFFLRGVFGDDARAVGEVHHAVFEGDVPV